RTRDQLKGVERTLHQQHDDLIYRAGQATKELEGLAAAMEAARARERLAQQALDEFASGLGEDSRASYEQRYARERQSRAPSEIYEVFERQQRAIETRIQNLIQRLIELKTRYVERRSLAAQVEGPGFEEVRIELALWRESRL